MARFQVPTLDAQTGKFEPLAYQDDTGGNGRGAVHLLLLNSDGSVKSAHKIANNTGGGPTLRNYDNFGSSLASLGDVDGDGVNDLAVGAERDDTGGNARGAAYVLFMKPGNRSPMFTSPAAVSVAENATFVTTATATDPDVPAQSITFSIVGGADQAKFSITGSGELSFIAPPDFEAPSDVGVDNVYEVILQASDGQGGVTLQTMSVTVTPVNDNSPMFTSADTVDVAENTTSVINLAATDADFPHETLQFSIVGGADRAKFQLNGYALAFTQPPNFEQPTDANQDNRYVVIVNVTDGQRSTLQAIVVDVTNVIDHPGDYSEDGVIDAADYVMWRKMLGASVPSRTGADGDGNGVVEQVDYDLWQVNFGESAPLGSAASAVAAADLATPIFSAVDVETEPMAVASNLGVDVAGPSDVPTSGRVPVDLVVEDAIQWRSSGRPVWRPAPVTAARRSDPLLALHSSAPNTRSSQVLSRELALHELTFAADLSGDPIDTDLLCRSDGELFSKVLDLAFASLGI